MSNNYFFSNKSFKSFENFDDIENNNNSLFMNNPEDNLLHSYNNEDEYDINSENNNDNYINNFSDLNSNELYSDSLYNNNNRNKFNLNLNFDNSMQFKNNINNNINNNIFQENNSLKDISSIEHISVQKLDEESNSNSNSNSNIINNINNISNNSSSTKDKSRIKNDIGNINNINQTKKEINKENNDNLNKKRKPRVHLEDLDIDPEIIKDKKFETIGDKVILSKNKILTEEDKKEIRAIRNRISAQKSRDKKKAEFILFKEKIQILTAQLKQKNLIIKNYEDVCCPKCKSKINEINVKILNENIDINKDEDDNELILDEDEEKKKTLLGKIPGLLIGLVCLIGISLCIYQYPFNNTNKVGNKITLTNLKIYNNNNSIISNATNITKDINETNDESFQIFEEPLVLNDNGNDNENYIDEIREENDNELLQMCHDKFIFDVYTNTKKKKDLEEKQKAKSGFLVKKSYDKFDPNSFCYGSNTIINGEYYMKNNNNINNTLPIQRDNIILNEYISNKIISVFIKDYESLKKFYNGKLLTLKEQIELSAKKSEDGCIYLQLIIPKNDIDDDNFKKNDTCPNDNARYFEVRCKILGYYNYYDGGV